ncbi:hypothetical protein JHK87_052521 [Glycine soja]|nr:hypothetical protein JHK87_052521 [Glycine soja]
MFSGKYQPPTPPPSVSPAPNAPSSDAYAYNPHRTRGCIDTLDGGMIEMVLDPDLNKTGDIWHICIEGGATLVDIACDPELVKLAIDLTSCPVNSYLLIDVLATLIIWLWT